VSLVAWHRMLVFGSFLAALAGCSSPPVLLNASEEGVIVRYGAGSTPAQALAAAQASCAKYGRHAVQQGIGVTGDVFTTFSCVK
jgi:hypothetical protein